MLMIPVCPDALATASAIDHDGEVELIAHRAGNEPHLISPALAVADTVELDVHLFRGRLEVRHAKVLWPFAIFWERQGFLRDLPRPALATILEAAPADTHLWFDLKGFTSRLPNRLLEQVEDRYTFTTSCRSWWTLRAARKIPGVRTFRSVANRRHLWLVQHVKFAHEDDGIVMHQRLATPEVLDRLHRLTPQVVVWAVEHIDRALELHAMGVSGIIADDLALLAELRRRLDPGSD
jgi:glycerophosphoryl diester phosphodiesterase